MRVSSNKSNIRVVFDEADQEILEDHNRWRLHLMSKTPLKLRMLPDSDGFKVQKRDGELCPVLQNTRISEVPIFGSVVVRVERDVENPEFVTLYFPDHLPTGRTYKSVRLPKPTAPSSADLHATRDEMAKLVEAKTVINDAKRRSPDFLEMSITEDGLLRMAYMREL